MANKQLIIQCRGEYTIKNQISMGLYPGSYGKQTWRCHISFQKWAMGEEENPGPQSNAGFCIVPLSPTKVLVRVGVLKIREGSLICPAIADMICSLTKGFIPNSIFGAFDQQTQGLGLGIRREKANDPRNQRAK
jgi:hypothetical protein